MLKFKKINIHYENYCVAGLKECPKKDEMILGDILLYV